MILSVADCGFQRGDRDSALGSGRASTRWRSLANLNFRDLCVVSVQPRHSRKGFPEVFAFQALTIVSTSWVYLGCSLLRFNKLRKR